MHITRVCVCVFFLFLSFFFFLFKYFCSRNNRFSFVQLYNPPEINTISSSIDAEHTHRSNQQQSLSHTLNQVHTDPPPSYDEIVLDMRLASPNTAIIY